MKHYIALLLLLSSSWVWADSHAPAQQENSLPDQAEAMVASMEKADMTYRELMEMMGASTAMMHSGVLRENPQLVKQGADGILTHPAPKHKPWAIMPEADKAAFKQSLLTYDKILDQGAEAVVNAAVERDWQAANKALGELNSACISCHALWKGKAQDITRTLNEPVKK